ncbi:hypothetical protein SEA_AYOTOYA_63 [Gordonia phage Ayotoya]|nr:hypothetical protein SEA_AYOTOYA_63 [Gordonia phage Ayotoya]URP21290.1 hypothetical protein SEA_CHOP_63 [Gordonia phage Chop]UXL91338.1 hypothetical protein SEA_GRANDSLAM_63 [Gordonia phage GrandSlam]
MTEHDERRAAVLAEHNQVIDENGIVVACTCGDGADRIAYGSIAFAEHRDTLYAFAALGDMVRAFSTTFALFADGIADAFRDITETTNKTQAGYDQARDRERAAIPKPATTPPIWANNPNQQRRRNNR